MAPLALLSAGPRSDGLRPTCQPPADPPAWVRLPHSGAHRRRGSRRVRSSPAGAGPADGDASSVVVEGAERDYCTDFVCSSSPSVEQTVKGFAADLERQEWSLSRFGNNVSYKDPYRSFIGVLAYKRHQWAKDSLGDSSAVVVKKLRMLDKGTALVSWKLSGQLGIVAVDVDFESKISMNPLTGRIQSHRDSWDLSRCSPPAAITFIINRALWSAVQSRKDVDDTEDDKPTDIMASLDDGDPTKIYFGQDHTMQDAILFATVLAIFYLMYRAYSAIFHLTS